MKNALRAAVASAVLFALAGCGPMPGLTDPAADKPSVAASSAPTNTTNTPTVTPTKAPSPKASTVPVAEKGPEACTRELGEYSTGTAMHGRFNNQRLPKDWATQLKSQDEVLVAIDELYIQDWPCFQKFYPGATTIYKEERGVE